MKKIGIQLNKHQPNINARKCRRIMAKDYSSLSKEELIEKIGKLESRKKYGLIWDEERVREKFETESENALPILREVKGKEIIKKDRPDPVNIFIEGDNYHALSVLNFTHQGAVDVIYIDPPYNTGARDWKYNNDYVDESDSFRHSKWISFMYKRLRLAKQVLSDDGIICVTIDDYELPRLLLIMEEIFGEENHLGTAAIRINPGGRKTKRSLAQQHEYALFFGKNIETQVAKVIKPIEEKTHSYKEDAVGWYEERNLRKEGQDSLASEDSARFYPIYFNPKNGAISVSKKYPVTILPIDVQGQKRIWRRGKEDVDRMFERGDLIYKKTKFGDQIYFKFRGGIEGETPKSFWDDVRYSASEHGTQTLDRILGKGGMFQFPKSPHAVMDCIKVCSSRKDAIVLDFFAGSGTTAQAVLELNKQDGGKRQFILCTNNEGNIATDVCYPRIKKVINGWGKNEGIGASLKYFKAAFVKKSLNKDDLKIRIANECTEMLCLRQGIFEEAKETADYRIFKQGNRMMGVYYSLDRTALKTLKKELDKFDGEKVLYCFTLDPLGLDKNDFIDWNNVDLEPIPQKILDVYEQIYEY
jgi:adenine-specific DNA-methyltransferase